MDAWLDSYCRLFTYVDCRSMSGKETLAVGGVTILLLFAVVWGLTSVLGSKRF
jgi:hypothetical protein